jgi:hypothetical protein
LSFKTMTMVCRSKLVYCCQSYQDTFTKVW